MNSKPALVIFDCDGVLVDSEPIANRILANYLSNLGFPYTGQHCDVAYRGLSMVSMIGKIEHTHQIILPPNFEQQLQQQTYAAFQKQLQPIAGVEAVLKQLVQRNIPICVASSGSHAKMKVTLSLTQLEAYFNGHIFSATQVKQGKPQPDLFLFAAQNMAIAPQHTLVVEDSMPGVQAALAAGMSVCAYCPGEQDRVAMENFLQGLDQRERCRIIRSMPEIGPVLVDIFALHLDSNQ